MLSLTAEEFETHLNADYGTLKNFNQGALQLITENMVTMKITGFISGKVT